ncbi:MAG: C10 family peptidase [Muribaculaceae bacterium]|nr:C10 family peptidase [Muribaculaceae bacterium]
MEKNFGFIFALIIMAMLYVSCDSETILTERTNHEESAIASDPSKDIIAKANLYYSMLPGKTRSAMPQVAKIEKIGAGMTRSEESPSYYIVNYENEAGFVVVGDNEFSEPVVALSDEGNLQLEDTLTNPALGAFINSLTLPPIVRDSDFYKPHPDVPVYNRVSVAPLLNPNVRKWGDGEPFNKYAPIVEIPSGKRAKVGCLPVSCAMLMTYDRWPNSYDFAHYDWDAITNDKCNDTLCKMLVTMAGYRELNTRYGRDETISNIDMITVDHMLRSFYSGIVTDNGKKLKDFDVSSASKVYEQLPLIMWGDVVRKGKTYTETWVIDGLLHVFPIDEEYGGITKQTYFMHCVWGKYGVGNGYYELTRLDEIGGSRFKSDSSDGTFEGYSNTNEVDTYNNNSYLFKLCKNLPMIDYL